MLKIHNNNFKKYKIPLISVFVVIGGMFLFSYLTYIPTQTFAIDTADPNETRTLMQIDTMQEMSEQICANTKENKTKRLRDERDGKYYWVAKLKDGNCWMTQNLDYDDPYSTRIDTLNKWTYSNVTNTTRAYYDAGDFVYRNAIPGATCKTTVGLEECVSNGWTDVQGWTASNNSNDDTIINESENTYDAHYYVGNYYSWASITGGTGNTVGDGNASSSLCPTRWGLPMSNSSQDGSFYNLLQQYGMTSNPASNGNTIYESPLYLLASGQVYAGNIERTSDILLWSSTGSSANSNTTTYVLGVYSNHVYPNDLWNRSYGLAARCFIMGGWLPNGGLDDTPLDSNQANVAITVSPVISIDATSGMSESIDFTQVAEGNITAKVSSNQAYQVLLSTEQSNLEQNPILANFNIPMVSNDTEITAGVNSWGVKKTLSVTAGGTAGDDTTLTNTLYSPIGIGDDKVLFYKSSGAESKTLVFPVAISVDATLPSGIYSTQVTITAVAN